MANWQNRIELPRKDPEKDLLRRYDNLAASGDFEGAVAAAREAIAGGSRRLSLHLRLTGGLVKLGHYRAAGQAARQAARVSGGSAAELVELGRRLMNYNDSGSMRGLAIRLMGAPPLNAAAEADFAAMLSMMGEQMISFGLLQRAMQQLGPAPPLLYNRSQMHLYFGRFQEAEADLRQALAGDPRMAKAHWALSKLPGVQPTDAELAAMETLAGKLPAGSQDEVFMRFALFNHLDRLDRRDQAWAQLERGCAAKRALLDYKPEASQRLFASLRGFQPGVLPPAQAPAEGPVPVFIVGMHRSGTTLLERILGSHSQVAAGGELYDFPAELRWALDRHFSGPSDPALAAAAPGFDFAAIGRRYLDRVRWRADGKGWLVDKLPSNFLNLGFIGRALPQAKVLHMRREPMDTGFSNLKELFSAACPYSYRQDELAAWYRGYDELMQHWRQTMPGYVLDVDYERLAAEPEAEARRILDFCGLAFEPGCVDLGRNQGSVNTASSAQVREPIHQRNVGAWRRYEERLRPLAEGLSGAV